MKIKTVTRKIHTVEFDGISLEVSDLPYSDESVLAERVGDTHIVVAYLVQDDNIDFDMGDGMGKLLSFHRHAPKDERLAGLWALGRNQYGDIDSENLTPDPYAVVVDCYDHGGQTWSVSGGGAQCQWDTARGAGVWVPDNCLREQMDSMNLEGVAIRDQAVTYCKQFLSEYNEKLAGNVFGCAVEVFLLSSGEWAATEDDACYGYVGQAYAMETLKTEFFKPTVKGITL